MSVLPAIIFFLYGNRHRNTIHKKFSKYKYVGNFLKKLHFKEILIFLSLNTCVNSESITI